MRGPARGRPLCVPEKALRHLGAAPRSVTFLGAESGVENRKKWGEKKLEKQVFPLREFLQNMLG